jgi:hypothetical protein
VNHRYHEKTPCPTYSFKRNVTPLTPVELLKAVDCLEYQSCEHEGWNKSEAKKECERLRAIATRNLPGYNEAPWGID